MKFSVITICIFIALCCGESGIRAVLMAYTGSIHFNSSGIPMGGLKYLQDGDTLETGENSFCDLMLNDRSIVRVKDNSRITFYRSSGGNTLRIDRGLITVITKKHFADRERFIVKTLAVSADINGRSFCVKVESGNSTYICACDGTAEVNSAPGIEGFKSGTGYHRARRFLLSGDGSVSTEADPGILYHSDTGIEQMARLIKE